ncbi:SRPBCC family protein [Streptomyces sp. RPT161]|uniref:SRPBCC family protein n=1 Tax=Streptomyces sp. RPT161 TaxID=3015993 RepID=UPI0022B93EA4|nr:SRPBCC family protein [Streptomyces sp. RPT161]
MADRSGKRAVSGAGGLLQELPTDRLLEEAQNLITAAGERALTGVAGKIGDATERLTDYANNGGTGLTALLTGGRSLTEGKSMVTSLLNAGMTQVKEKVKDVVGGHDGGGDKGKKIKVTNIVESIDVGVPVSLAYNQWTQFEDFPTFMKKVESVKQQSETELDWKAQVFFSHRKWKARVIEQVPDERIIWESEAEKGHVDGAVTFHELTPDLTKIVMVLQYHPQGFFERTGNIWRAQGRRARLELKHFQRHVMTEAILNPDDIHGWRGEVLDGEVVRSDEEVREEEEGREERGTSAGEEEEGRPEAEEGQEDEEDRDDEEGDEEEAEGEEGPEDDSEAEDNSESEDERARRPQRRSAERAR